MSTEKALKMSTYYIHNAYRKTYSIFFFLDKPKLKIVSQRDRLSQESVFKFTKITFKKISLANRKPYLDN